MKIYPQSIVAIFLTMSATSIFASISCSSPKLSAPVKHDSVYHFKAVVTCKLVGETIDVKAIKDAYRAEILDKKSQFKVHGQKDYDDKKGMKGYALDATQSYDTDHGRLAVRGDMLLLDDNTANFFYQLRSKSIIGQDDAKFNKSIFNEVTLKHLANYDELVVVKEIDVEEPWYAPDSTFFNTVASELTEAISQSAMQQAKKIRGDKVDALRK